MKLYVILLLALVQARLHYKEPDFEKKEYGFGAELPKGTVCNKLDSKAINEKLATTVIYSGYLNISPTSSSCLAFIFYGSQKAKTEDDISKYPTIIWLNGGPGSSSQIGNFQEMGPILIDKEGNPSYNNASWNVEYNMMFVDQPIGTGFSFAADPKEIPTDQDQVASQFFNAFVNFLTDANGCVKKNDKIKGLLTSPWFIFGESYAGKYVPSIASAIIKWNLDKKNLQIPLRGIGIGDPFTDPYIVTAEYASYAYNLGLIDFQERAKAEGYILGSLKYLSKGDTVQSKDYFEKALDYIVTQSGDMNVYNVLQYGDYEELDVGLNKYLAANQKTLYQFAEDYEFSSGGGDVYAALTPDFMRRDNIERLEFVLKNIPVIVYNGQNDLICSGPGTSRWTYQLTHNNTSEFQKLDFEPIRLVKDGTVVGYKKQAGNLWYWTINNAGHLVPYDQPEAALYLVKTFVEKNKK
ncbi:hypothetical protein pb186bvf_010044 [Paramecium bursaria]